MHGVAYISWRVRDEASARYLEQRMWAVCLGKGVGVLNHSHISSHLSGPHLSTRRPQFTPPSPRPPRQPSLLTPRRSMHGGVKRLSQPFPSSSSSSSSYTSPPSPPGPSHHTDRAHITSLHLSVPLIPRQPMGAAGYLSTGCGYRTSIVDRMEENAAAGLTGVFVAVRMRAREGCGCVVVLAPSIIPSTPSFTALVLISHRCLTLQSFLSLPRLTPHVTRIFPQPPRNSVNLHISQSRAFLEGGS
ncbi:hypothetical protein E2C01_088328 [Portunus trituberculatus]|uniref:Uncharacterized protein n=1 Tax=Portunus trituberculatus TaxID=210409 RepID=A0A5B7JF35_PORTR|nr:hypothetical protein [Portunus trituberculatus]